MDDLEAGISEDLASILDNGKMMEGQTNKRLREFFKKLLQTDAQIRKLKQTTNNNNYQIDNIKTGRYKRALKKLINKHIDNAKANRHKVKKHTKKSTCGEIYKNDKKRYATTASALELPSYVIESKEVVIRHDPDKKRNFPKCSHVKNEKTHEKDLKNPFYKHSQMIDDMLDPYTTFDATTDNFDIIFDNNIDEHLETTNKTYDTDKDDESLIESITKMSPKPKVGEKSNEHENSLKKYEKSNEHVNIVKSNDKSSGHESSIHNHANNNNYHKSIQSHSDKNSETSFIAAKDYDKRMREKAQFKRFNDKNDGPTHQHLAHYFTTIRTTLGNDVKKSDIDDDLYFTIPSLINPMNKAVFKPNLVRNLHTGQRKLLQDDEEDEEHEELGYEDLNEVLTDDKEGHDDMDRHGEKKKRHDEGHFIISGEFNQDKHNPPIAYNQNWKGPMPLYPDELNAIIKQADLQNLDMQVPVNTKDIKEKRNIGEKEISDTQYVEDYADNKYKKIIRMAQAYSDYGVLSNKKENINKSSRRAKSHYLSRLFSMQNIFGNPGKGSTRASEINFGFNVRPGSTSNNKDFLDAFKKHLKFCGTSHGTSTALNPMEQPINPMNFELEKLLMPSYNLLDTSLDASTTIPTSCLILSIKKSSRTPKSIYVTNGDTDGIKKAKLQSVHEVFNIGDLNMADETRDIIDKSSVLNQNEIKERTHGNCPFNAAYNNIANKRPNSLTLRKCLRSLKSIDLINDTISSTFNKTSKLELTARDITIKNDTDKLNDTVDETNSLNLTKSHIINIANNKSNNGINGIQGFMKIMSNWFYTVAKLSGEIKNEVIKESKRNNNTLFNQTAPKPKGKITEENINFMYPSYGVEMVDNIGHRSRMLMSLDDNSAVKDEREMEKSISKTDHDSKKTFSAEIDDIVPVALALATNDTEKPNAKSKTEDNATRTVAKRSLRENLVFWNDLYDNNEYGVKVDYTDDIRDPRGKQTRNILNKSKTWLQGKISNVTHKLKGKWKQNTIQKKTTCATDNLLGKTFNDTLGPSEVVIKERYARDSDRTLRRNTKKNFAALNANMKKVCQEAAKAIQNTKNIEAKIRKKNITLFRPYF
ncbi:jg20395 [Pararge aegeria aegeria]|uniref:Jg20395 protein n=1 Tax=Pararge aegeria aegeria TaxID=348720 RepID=A0A8S4SAJ5_9NEOP|nr:jg20395 [Pararge aegeria aegeria]